MSRPYAEVIGDPIAHSKSPLIHKFWLTKLGIDGEYRACHVRPHELADYFAQRRGDAEWRGCNVTLPHKANALIYVSDAGRQACEAKATNCVIRHGRFLWGVNTDWEGVLAAVPVASFPICIIGNGGAARVAFSVLDPFRPEQVRLLVRDPKRASAMIAEMLQPAEIFSFDAAAAALAGCGGVVNASPLGMVGQAAMPANVLEALALTDPEAFVFDMVYVPVETELLKRARKLGRVPRDGLLMLVAQAAAAFELFFGQPAPREHDAELRALLTA